MATLACRIREATESDLEALVEDVIVHPAHRGRGLATRPLEAVEGWCRARGIGWLQLLMDRGNASADAFFRRMGWVETRLVALRKRVAPGLDSSGSRCAAT